MFRDTVHPLVVHWMGKDFLALAWYFLACLHCGVFRVSSGLPLWKVKGLALLNVYILLYPSEKAYKVK